MSSIKVNNISPFSGVNIYASGEVDITGSLTVNGEPIKGGGFPYTGSARITGSLDVTGSVSVDGSIVATNGITASSALITGTLTTETLVATYISSSIIYSSGSNIFGDQLTDTQQLTGSVTVTGSLSLNNDPVVTSIPYNTFSSSIESRTTVLEQASASFSSSIAQLLEFSSSLDTGYVTEAELAAATSSLSASIAILSSSYESFTETYNTGSFTGVFSGSFSGSFSGNISNIDGATNYIAKFDSNNTIDPSVIYQSASHIAINETAFTTDNPEALYVFQTHPTSINVLTGKGNLNHYLQNNIQNTNQGISASSDVVATANNGNEDVNYIDMGINSENYNQGFIGGPNDAYLYSIANNLHIGSAATGSQHVALFVGGDDVDANTKIQLNANNRHIMSGSFGLTGSLNVLEGITGSLYGTASWAITASHALSGNGQFIGSFAGDGSGLTNVPASGVVGLNLSLIGSGSVTASTDPVYGFRVNSNSAITGSLIVTAGITGSLLGTASFANNATNAATASSANTFFVRQDVTASNALITGTITAQTLVVQTVTSSVVYSSGSTVFGNDLSNTQQFTGSVTITGSLAVNNDPVVTNIPYNAFSQSIQYRATELEATASILTTASASYAIVSSSYASASGSLSTRVITLENASGSFASDSGSNSVRLTHLESTASVLTTASASFAIVSASYSSASSSLSIRTTDLEVTASVLTTTSASFAVVSASYASASGSLSQRVNVLESASASFALDSGSNSTRLSHLESTASVLTTASASFASVSSSYASASGSLSIRVTDLESTASVLTTASASFASNSGSNSVRLSHLESTASILTTASASFALVSASFSSTSQSISNRVHIIEGNYATTGSNIFVGNQTVTGSLFTSGSNTLVGSTTLTGSLNISGSTVQVGNNTLLGDTNLSGSIIISGTLGSTPSVKIYGDTQHNGYIRFDPVTTNIDTSISASYIYVSGSTQDLYFSQNNKGYSNVTRLRWLEGNLFTGLLNGGLITTQSSTVYQISSGSGIIVDLNASLSDDPYPTIQYLNWGNLSASIAPFTSSYQQAFVGIDSTNNIYAQGTPFSNGQFDTVINIGNVLFQNQSTINGVKTQPSTAYGFEQAQNVFNRAFGPLKLSGYTLAASGSSTGSLIVGSGTAYSPGSNYTIDPNEPYYTVDNGTTVSKIFRYYQSGSTWVYQTNAGAGFATIDPTQYSDNGTLTAVPAPAGSNWTIQRVYWFPNSVTKAIVVYYGNAYYGSESEAIANINIESFVEAPNTAANAIYLGAIVISGNGVFTNSATYKIVPGGLFRSVGGSGGGGSVVTQTLSGLSDVSISGPTNGQPLVYNTTSGKWQNSSTLTATLTGNASTATSASHALTSSYAITSSHTIQADTASYVLQAVSSSFATTASYVLNAISASYAATASSADDFVVRQNATASNLLVNNTITAQTLVVQTITSSVEFVTGSTIFGSLLTNTHEFTGSVSITGSLSLNNSPVITDSTLTPFSSSVSTRLVDLESTASILTTASASFAIVSSSYASASGSLSTRVTTLEQASASFALDSGSNSTRLTALESTASVLTTASASFATDSGSNSIRLTDLELTASVLTTASASFALVSSSYSAFTLSYNTGSFTGSFTGDGSGLINIPASGIVGLNLSQIASGSATASISPVEGFRINTNTEITGSLIVTAGITGSLLGTASYAISSSTAIQATTASYVLNAVSASYALTASYTLNVTGSVNFLAKFTGSTGNNVVDSIVSDNGKNISVNGVTVGTDGAPNSTNNLIFGYGAMPSGTSSNSNVAIGDYTLENISTGNGNVGVGLMSLRNITTGYNNTAIGTDAGRYEPGPSPISTNNTSVFVGNFTRASSNGNTNEIVIGDSAIGNGSNTVTLGNTSITRTILRGGVEATSFTGSLFGTATDANNATNAATASSADTFIVRQDVTASNALITGTITAQTLVVQTVTSSIVYSSGSNIFGNQLTDVQQFTGSINSTGSVFLTGLTSSSYANVVGYDIATGQLYYQTTGSGGGSSVTASYALTASAATNFTVGSTLTIDRTLTDYATVASSVAGSNNLFTQAVGSYTSAFFKYTVTNGSNARSGEVMSVLNGSTVEFTDNSTLDIGSTTPVTCSVSVVGSDIQFNVQTNTSGWSIKSLATYM